MLRFIDSLLDRVTMYRLMLYYLIFLLVAAFLLCEAGRLNFKPYEVAISAIYLTAVCWVVNLFFAYVFEAPANKESSLITGLILALIISPMSGVSGLPFLTAAAVLAVASKYVLAIRKQHIFNPAAIAVVLTALGAGQAASWWVGTGAMLPFVIAGGLLVARKINRYRMVLAFSAATYLATIIYTFLAHGDIAHALHQATLGSALFFLAFVMLTEPATSPVTNSRQIGYGVLVGLLFPPQVHVGAVYGTPELALAIGNIFTYLTEPKAKLFPKLVQKSKLAAAVAEFVLEPGAKFNYQPGQYMEWTLPHPNSDSRGDRRYLTLASSPTETRLRLGVKIFKNGSSYKRAMLHMDTDTPMVAARLAGDFTMPKKKTRKLVFIAGGIGITPYRSMLKYLLDKKERRDIVVLYSVKNAEEIVYKDVLEAARRQLGIRVIYCLTGRARHLPAGAHYRAGYVTPEFIEREIPDYKERLFYISGSHNMVNAVRDALKTSGVKGSRVKSDFFPGYK